MRKRNSHVRKETGAPDCLPTVRLAGEIDLWIEDAEIRHSPRTVANRRRGAAKFLWFLTACGHSICGPAQVRAFLAYLVTGHTEPEGRWGMAGEPGKSWATRPMHPNTRLFYYSQIRSLCQWLVEQKAITVSPLTGQAPPTVRTSQPRPFTPEQVQKLFAAAQASRESERGRNVLILLLLFDTGIRASEMCGLLVGDVDFSARRVTVHGKGGKDRAVPLGDELRRRLWRSIAAEGLLPLEPLFVSARGKTAGEALTRGGLHRIIQRLGKAAGITSSRCSPHTLRHSFAVALLKNGGNAFALRLMLGHNSLSMTQKYVELAEADLAEVHKTASPADNLFGRRRKR